MTRYFNMNVLSLFCGTRAIIRTSILITEEVNTMLNWYQLAHDKEKNYDSTQKTSPSIS